MNYRAFFALCGCLLTLANNYCTAQTPYDDFVPSTVTKPMLALPNTVFKIINPDTTGIVKYLSFDKENQSVTYYSKNDSVLGTEILASREVKWWSVDPLANEAAGMTPYGFVDNNPITNIDPDGRKTLYYSLAGELLFESDDNLPDAISIVNDGYVFQQLLDANQSLGNGSQMHSNSFNQNLRGISTNYMVGGMISIYDESLTTSFTEDGRYVDPNTGVTPSNLHPELSSYMYDDGNGNVYVGKERFVGSPRGGSVGNNLQPNPKAKIHTHSSDGVSYKDTQTGVIFKTLGNSGVSETDVRTATGKGYYDIMVDENSIHLYGGSGVSIEVPKAEFKKP